MAPSIVDISSLFQLLSLLPAVFQVSTGTVVAVVENAVSRQTS